MDFEKEDFNKLLTVALKYKENPVFLFDEIQYTKHWQLFVRRLHRNGFKIYITGSNSLLLSTELSTALAGRHLDVLLLPFSFKELLSFHRLLKTSYSTREKSKVLKIFDDYLLKGGYPAFVLTKDKEVLRGIYEDIVIKDVAMRYGIKAVDDLKKTSVYLATAMAKYISYLSLSKLLGISPTTASHYVECFENVFFLKSILKYGESTKKVVRSPKKIYFLDNGLRNLLVTRRDIDRGNLLENTVFIHLFRKGYRIFYFKERHECDFIFSSELSPNFHAVQVCYELNEQNKEREVGGLVEAMEFFKLKEGLILTYDQEGELSVGGKKIIIMPVWKWLLK